MHIKIICLYAFFVAILTFCPNLFGQESNVFVLPDSDAKVTNKLLDSSVNPLSGTPQVTPLSAKPLMEGLTAPSDCDSCNQPKPTEPKFPTVQVTGFFHLDTGFYSQDATNELTLGDIDDGTGFRRARLAAKGNVAEDVSYILEFDVAQSQARFVDVWMQLDKSPLGNVRIGRFRQPFGMSELTSVRELPFLERPVTFSQSPFRQTGVMFFDTYGEEDGTWAISGYRFLSDNFGNVFSDAGGYGLATRLTKAWQPDRRTFHAGFDYSVNDPGGGLIQIVSTNEFFVGQNPNLGLAALSVLPIVGVPPFVNSGPINTDTIHFFNFESGVGIGRFAFQSEARWVRVNETGAGPLDFPGAYAQVRYMLTGEEIPYVKKEGVFGRIIPHCNFDRCGGWGAWEVNARVSHIDLNDAAIMGRRLTDWTVGCNWYWNKYTKLQCNWIHSRLNDVAIGNSTANTVAFRAQLDF